MDNKQKRRILSSVYKATIFFVFCSIVWVGYFTINNFVNNTSTLIWLDISILSIAFLLLLDIAIDIAKTKKLKNLFVLSKYLFFVTFITVTAVIAGVFALYYTGYSLPVGYYLTVGVLVFAVLLSIVLFVVSLKLAKLYKGTTVYIEEMGEVPNYDDELMLKKKLDELNRKKEMQKVVNQIEELKNELGEN